MKKSQILIVFFIILSSNYVRGQMMFGTDNSLRTSYLPSAAGYSNEVYGSWLEYHSYLGQIKAGNSVIGVNWRLPFDGSLFRQETEIGIGPMFQYRENEFWTETSFRFPFASRVKIAEKWWTSIGFCPSIKLYSEPRELTREQYDDPTFLPTQERQTVGLLDLGWSLDYANTFYLDLGCQSFMNSAFPGTSGPKVDEQKIWTLNTAYKFGGKRAPTKVRLGMLFELSGLGKDQKALWLARPSIQLLFLDEKFWLKYTFVKNNSLIANEFAQRFLAGFGKEVNINFAYTIGNSQLYKHSQGNFELFIVWNFDNGSSRSVSSRREGHAVPCSTINNKQNKKRR